MMVMLVVMVAGNFTGRRHGSSHRSVLVQRSSVNRSRISGQVKMMRRTHRGRVQVRVQE
jgi:hypothetical protein